MRRLLQAVPWFFYLAVGACGWLPPKLTFPAAFLFLACAVASSYLPLLARTAAPNPASFSPRRDLPYTAYLVLTLDVSKSPPVALSIDVYSSSARDLTIVSRTTHTVDLERMDALTYHDARELLLRLAPKQWPWMAALIRKDPDVCT